MKKPITFVALWLALAGFVHASRVVQDETGRSVTLPDRVERIVCLTPSVTDTVYALGASEQIVGISDFTMYPKQAAREKQSVGDILKPSLERIYAMHPDVVIAVSTLNSPETFRGLDRIGVAYFLVHGRGLAGVYSSIESIGRAIGREHEASALLLKLKAREQAVRASARKRKPVSVFLVVQLDPCITAGKGAFITELIEASGAKSVTDDLAQDWQRVSLEAILPRHPAYIMLMKTAPIELKDMQSRVGWKSLEAVQRGRIIRADDRLQSPSPVAFDGLEDLARTLESLK
ncbi:MAG TPA: helical backbone metal receptor [Terriglobales bacterium]|nr:helical backbone metal receptor [Terriglobales bacterium]